MESQLTLDRSLCCDKEISFLTNIDIGPDIRRNTDILNTELRIQSKNKKIIRIQPNEKSSIATKLFRSGKNILLLSINLNLTSLFPSQTLSVLIHSSEFVSNLNLTSLFLP